MFRAHDPQRERLVAVKLFKLDLPPERVHQLVAAFERLIAADLTHPVLASPLATGITGVSAFLVQDYVAAESLDLTVREYGAVPPAAALRVAAQLGGALDFGAVVDIFHGSLHPRDVLLSTDETRLTGLGVARALEQVGVIPPVRRPYTAPERIAGSPWDRRADVFSLAALLHELLWGRRVSGTGKQAAEGLTEMPGGDLETLRVVFTHALADQPADRFETALEFAEALKQAFPDVAITGPSPTLNPRTPKRKARAQPAAPDAPVEPIEPRLPLSDPEPLPAPVPASEPIPAPRVEPPAPDDEVAPPIAGETPVVPDLHPEPLSLPLAEATFEPAFRTEEPSSDFVLHHESSSEPPIAYVGAEVPAVVPGLALAPQPAPPAGPRADLRPEPFSVLQRSRSAVWPLVLALTVGIAIGFAAGYGLGPRERSATMGETAGREFTEGTVESPKAEVRPPEDVRLPVPRPGEGKPDTGGAPTVAKAPVPPSKPAAAPQVETAPGRVLVRSTPSGARVVVDGRDQGTTPRRCRI